MKPNGDNSAASGVLFVLVPTFNEAGNIERMVRRLLGLPAVGKILVVDDYSPDGTARLVRQTFGSENRVTLIERKGTPGRGSASAFGYQEFLESGFEWLCEIDADFQEDPDDIPRLLEYAQSTGAELVVGSRYISGGSSDSEKSWLSLLANFCLKALFQSRIQDVSCSFHVIHRKVIEGVPLSRLTARTFFLFAQLHILAERMGFRCVELACHFPARTEGDSKVSIRHVFRFGLEGLAFWMLLFFDQIP